MQVDAHVDRLMKSLSQTNDADKTRELLRWALLEVARDQRHACAEAVVRIDRNAWSLDAAHSAVMNA